MKALTTRITDSVKEQHRLTALSDCLATWDGEVTQEVVEQGIHDRLRAMGRPIEGIAFKRVNLNCVEAHTPDGKLFTVHYWTGTGSTDMLYLGDNPFSASEQRRLATWLVENFYHL